MLLLVTLTHTLVCQLSSPHKVQSSSQNNQSPFIRTADIDYGYNHRVNTQQAVTHDSNVTTRTWCVCNNGITLFYLPPTYCTYLSVLASAGHHRHLAGTHFACPRRDGQAELTWAAGYTSG